MKELKIEPLEEETVIGREIKSEPIKREPVDDDDYSIQNSELLVPKLEEPDDFEYPNYMKIEPNPEEDYSDLLIPEREPSFNQNKVKLEPEPQDEYDFSDVLGPNLEEIKDYSNHLTTKKDQRPSGPNRGHVKLEPKPEEDFSDLLVPDLRQSSFCPNQVKLEPEPHDEDDFSNLLEPETEEPDHLNRPSSPTLCYSSSEHYNSLLKSLINSFGCSLCSATGSEGQIGETKSIGRKLILLIGSILTERKTMEEAKGWFQASRLYFCKTHLPEVAQSIYKILGISNIGELKSCSIANRKKLMTIVNELYAELDFNGFKQMLLDFMAKMNVLEPLVSRNVKRQPEGVTPHPLRQRSCGICSHRKAMLSMQNVKSNKKLILMVGSILSGKKTKKEALRTIFLTCIPVCKSHFSETIAQIFGVLNIKNAYKMTFSPSYKQNLMPIVNFLNPECDFTQFKTAMKDFCQRNSEM